MIAAYPWFYLTNSRHRWLSASPINTSVWVALVVGQCRICSKHGMFILVIGRRNGRINWKLGCP